MRKLFALLVTGLVAFVAMAQSFDADYSVALERARYGSKVYFSAIRPVWTGEDSFVFRTQTPDGEVFYKVEGTEKTVIGKDEFDAAMKHLPRPWYDPSDDSQFAHKREVKEMSPDSSKVAFVRDDNVWVSAPDGTNALQLSFDGTEADAYTEIMWSPDGKKLAALKKEVLKERQILLLANPARPTRFSPNTAGLTMPSPVTVCHSASRPFSTWNPASR